MSFKISIADVEGTVKTESQAAQGWTQAADDVMSALQGLCGLSCMQGAAADALRSRVYECLVPVAQSARLLATEYSARLLVYQDSWHSAESSASDARNKCGTAEAKGADAFDEVEQFVSALDAYVSRVESSTASGFVPGKLASSPEAKALSAQFEASLTRVQQMRPQIEDAAQREQDYYQKRADEEAAKQREEQGWWQIAGGVVAGVVGVGAIVLTAGAATPIVVGAAVAGSAAFACGAAKAGGSDVPRFEASEKVPDDFRGVYADADGGLHVKVEPVGFNVNHNAKYDPAELDRQLKGQNEGLKRLTVKEYLENRAEYKENGRGKVASAKQREAREIARDKIIQELRDKGLSRNEAKTEAKRIMAGQAALHEPDMVAGGKADGLQALTGNYSDGHYGLGDSGANSSLGAQWRNKCADALEQSIKDAVKGLSPEDLDSIYIDVDLRLTNWPQ